MRQAAEHLREQQTGPDTQRAEQAAIARLAILVAALEPENNDNSTSDNKIGVGGPMRQDQSDGPRTPNAAGTGVMLLAEVKFLKLWQEDLNRRTQQLELDAARMTAEELRHGHAQLAEEQARLAAATLQLRNPQKADADAPDVGTDEKTEN